MDFQNLDYEAFLKKIASMATEYVPKILLALAVLYVGFKIVGQVTKLLDQGMKKNGISEDLRPFFISLLRNALKILIIISAAGIMGVETASFIAILAAAGLAVGLALQGNLSNLAGGVLILLFKPFRTGDLITAQDHTGFVQEILIFHTIMETLDHRNIIIPNALLSNGVIENITMKSLTRLDMTFGVSYDADIDQTREVIMSVIARNPHCLKDKEHKVHVVELGDSSVNFRVHIWADGKKYWDNHFFMHEEVKKALDKVGISIPFPQRDVHLFQQQ